MSRIDHIAAHDIAVGLLKEAGFIVDHVATKTETVYMAHPSSPTKFIRVSTHRFKGSPIGLNGVAANLTLSRRDPYHTPTNVRNKVLFAIGHYFLGQARTSEYRGPKGTWEDAARAIHVDT